MRIDVITLFPEMFQAVSESGITSRAVKRGLWELHLWNPREQTTDNHRTVDERPYGGGPGMVMMAEPLKLTLDRIRADGNSGKVYAMMPTGTIFSEELVSSFCAPENRQFVLICGRYEGIDERFLKRYVDGEISIGDYVLSGGELAAMVIIDAVVRRIPGAIKEESADDESFKTGLLDSPHYTRPEVWEDEPVPEVLLTGHHENIARWTRHEALKKTWLNRPDLIRAARINEMLGPDDEKFLKGLAELEEK